MMTVTMVMLLSLLKMSMINLKLYGAVVVFRRDDFPIKRQMDIPGLIHFLRTTSYCNRHLEERPHSDVLSILAHK